MRRNDYDVLDVMEDESYGVGIDYEIDDEEDDEKKSEKVKDRKSRIYEAETDEDNSSKKSATEEEPYDIKNHTLLSVEETMELLKKVKTGDLDARNKLIERNIRLVKSVARSFPGNTIVSKNDLIQEGVLGLCKAIDKFDIKKGCMFSTYATWWIRQAMQRALADSSKTIKLPVYLQEEVLRIKKVQKQLEQDFGRMPSIKEIAEALRFDCSSYDDIVNHEFFENLISAVDSDNADERREIEGIIMEDFEFDTDVEFVLKNICELAKKKKRVPTYQEVVNEVNLDEKKIKHYLDVDANANAASLDVPAGDDFDTNYGDNIPSDENVENTVNQNVLAKGLIKALDEIYGTGKNSKEYYIKTHSRVGSKTYDPTGEHFIPKNELMKYRYGIDGHQKETLEQLGKRYNVSRERVRQIEKKILGCEVDKDGNKKESMDAILFKKKIKEYCGIDMSDFM